MCADLSAALRRYGVEVGTAQSLTFYAAVHELGDFSLAELFWAGRAVLASDPAAYAPYALAFAECFSGVGAGEDLPPAARPPLAVFAEEADQSGRPPRTLAVGEEVLELPEEARVIASAAERLRAKSFAAMTAEERREAARMIREMRLRLDRRPSRRRTTARTGPFLDMRGTLRLLLSTDGEPTRLGRRRRRIRQRPVTFLVDVSGSMAAYGQAILRFAHALMRVGERVEVFTVGVRLHRVTDALRSSSADRALERAGQAVSDWDGGTRLASSFSALLRRRHGQNALRGAVVVICSDGLDHDDPVELAAAMARFQRLSHRLVWLNPLKADPRYRPLARGMAAALPYIDDFRAGHNIASLEGLTQVLAGRGSSSKKGGRP
ncbi:VWA domain-containing protein [Georgenia thermotolerans]|uniref:VWA domain-containing protein n=1 Tax=Georgenia thermotolerans TaxID=527326 RepID=A0A7J5UUL2_9MICO|nr:VWA domain-containing protein [Georgenia thermotolerans]